MKIQKNISLDSFATLKIGGAAKWFAEARDEEEIIEALEFARENKLSVFVLGGGSNILVSDQGFEGLALKIQNTKYQILNTKIECGAGCSLGTIVGEVAKFSLSGLEWAAGIPGTVGGAVRGNAGAFGGEMGDVIDSVKVIEIPPLSKARLFPPESSALGIPQSQAFKSQLPIANYQLRECQFAYRDSIFKQNPNLVILSVTLKLAKGNEVEIQRAIKEIISKRKAAQPFDFPSSGSFFKNPAVKSKQLIKEYEKDTGDKAKNNIIPAGYLIDRAGLRGKKIGGAMVSRQHGNFLVNAGQATAEEMIILISVIKNKVRDKFGIQLQEEVQYVGF